MCVSTFAATGMYVQYVHTYVYTFYTCVVDMYVHLCMCSYLLCGYTYVHVSIHTCACLAEKNIRPLHKDCILNI